MQIRKIVARVFFATAMGAMLVSVFDVPRVQAQTELDAGCSDGDRKLCKRLPQSDGTEKYWYWQ